LGWYSKGRRFAPWLGIFFKLARCGYTLRVTSQASYSHEYITPTQKKRIHNYTDVFDEKLGTLPGKIHLQVDATCKPVMLPAIKIAVAVREKFKNELKRLEDFKAIALVDKPTELVSQIVAAMKKSGS
jgi:hypothetical protein